MLDRSLIIHRTTTAGLLKVLRARKPTHGEQLLALLRAQKFATHDVIITALWGPYAAPNHIKQGIGVLVHRLRSQGHAIVSEPSRGYRLVPGPVVLLRVDGRVKRRGYRGGRPRKVAA